MNSPTRCSPKQSSYSRHSSLYSAATRSNDLYPPCLGSGMLNCGSGIASFILTKSKMPQFDVGIVLLLLELGFVVLTRVFPIVGNVVQPLLDRPVPWMDRVCVSRA